MARKKSGDVTKALTGVAATGEVGSIPYTSVSNPLTREARQLGGRRSGKTRRDKTEIPWPALRRSVDQRREGQTINEILLTHLRTDLEWSALEKTEQTRRLDNLARVLRKKRSTQ